MTTIFTGLIQRLPQHLHKPESLQKAAIYKISSADVSSKRCFHSHSGNDSIWTIRPSGAQDLDPSSQHTDGRGPGMQLAWAPAGLGLPTARFPLSPSQLQGQPTKAGRCT